jgi:hypothetical protein
MVTRSVQTVPDLHGMGWLNTLDDVTVSRHWTRLEAIDLGRKLARQHACEHVVYKTNGTISERQDYRQESSALASLP